MPAAVTSTEIVQLLLPATVALPTLMLPLPGTAVMLGVPQPADVAPLGEATTSPVGSGSLKL